MSPSLSVRGLDCWIALWRRAEEERVVIASRPNGTGSQRDSVTNPKGCPVIDTHWQRGSKTGSPVECDFPERGDPGEDSKKEREKGGEKGWKGRVLQPPL